MKFIQDTVSQNFVVTVSFEKSLDSLNVTNRIANRLVHILGKIGVATVSVTKNSVTVEIVSYNDVSLDNVLLLLVDDFKVGFWDYLGIGVITVSVITNKDGSSIKLCHKNAHKLQEDKKFSSNFADGLQYFEVFRDTVLIDKFDTSHVSALQSGQQIEQILQDLLNSRK